MTATLAVGVDIGATKIATALVTTEGKVIASRKTATQTSAGPTAVLERVAGEIRALLALAEGPVAGIGIGTPGIVVPSEGVVRNAVNLGWHEVSLVSGVRARLGLDLPVWVQKDTNASALGEYYFGASQGCRDFVYISIGSGLGGGIISNGQIITGASWQSSELGHFSLDPQGRLCACGLRGCAETLVSGPGLLAVARERLANGEHSPLLQDSAGLNSAAILAAAREQDPLAVEVFAEAGAALGVVLGMCVTVLNPAMFVIGGGLGLAAFDLMMPAAQRELERRVVPTSYQDLKIVPSCLTSSAVGASCLVWYGLGGNE
jgi:glucokinase